MTTIGSLCTGYGGLDLAVAAHYDARVVWHAEYDKHAATVADRHWPGTPNLGDITTTDWDAVEPVDIICGGYPCQPFSHAGKRKGTKDERHIWPYIADALRVLRPRVCVFENVAGHLGLGFAAVLADLARLGFDVEWGVVQAADAGAPHRRQRLFIVATDRDTDRGQQSAFGDVPTEHVAEPAGVGASAADTDVAGLEGPQPAQRHDVPAGSGGPDLGPYTAAVRQWEHITGRPAPDPAISNGERRRLDPRFVEWMMGLPDGWVCDTPGLPHSQQLKILGNGVVPQQAALALALLNGSPAAVHSGTTPLLPTPTASDARDGRQPRQMAIDAIQRGAKKGINLNHAIENDAIHDFLFGGAR